MVNDLELRRAHPLYSTLQADATFHELLLVFDQDIAIVAAAGTMPAVQQRSAFCPASPQASGRPAGLGEEHDWRFSFCCASDGCRTRRTPPLLRFLGRKVYLTAIVVLIAIMREGAPAARMRQLSELSASTAERSSAGESGGATKFLARPFWQIGRAAFMPPVDHDRLPVSLIECFNGGGDERLIAFCASSPRSPEATGAVANGFSRSAEDAHRRQSRPPSTVRAP